METRGISLKMKVPLPQVQARFDSGQQSLTTAVTPTMED